MLIRTAALAALFVVAACDPQIRVGDLDGRNATNNAFRVIVDRDAPFRAAVLAQEVWETEQKQDPVQAVRIRLDDDERREMEIMGHEVEVAAAVLFYGQDAAAYRAKEAASMQRGYDGLFRKMTPAQIAAAMERQSAKATRWVEKNRKRLEKHK